MAVVDVVNADASLVGDVHDAFDAVADFPVALGRRLRVIQTEEQ